MNPFCLFDSTLFRLSAAVVLLGWTAPRIRAEAPTMTSIYSPGSTVKLQMGGKELNLRKVSDLPNAPFSVSTGEGDMVQIQFDDGSSVRLAPHSTVEFVPGTREVTLYEGTVLLGFSPNSRMRVTQMDITGQDALVLASSDQEGRRVLPIRGAILFMGKDVGEGHIAVAQPNGLIADMGRTDMDQFRRESPILVDLPGSPRISTQLPVSPNQLAGALDSLQAAKRRAEEFARRDTETVPFFGSAVAGSEGAAAQIQQDMARLAIHPGAGPNPRSNFEQIQQENVLASSRSITVSAGGSGAPPPPPLPGGLVFGGGWTIDAVGNINFGLLTLTPSSFTGGVAKYSVESLSIGSAANLAAFTGAGGNKLDFTSTGVNAAGGGFAGGNGFEIVGGLNLGTVSLSLTSLSSSGDITTSGGTVTSSGSLSLSSARDVKTAGVSSTAGSASLTAQRDATDTGTVAGATGVTVTGQRHATLNAVSGTSTTGAGGDVSVTATTGNVTVGGNVSANAAAGTGGKGGNVALRADSGTVAVTGTITTTGAGSAAAGGGNGGDVTVNATAATLTGAVATTGGTSTFSGAGNKGGDGGAVTVTTTTGDATVTGGASTTGGGGGLASGATEATLVSAGAGGKGGVVAISATAGSVLGGGNVVSQGGAGGAAPGAAPVLATSGSGLVVGQAAGAGGDAGNVTIRSGGAAAASVNLGDVKSVAGNAGALTASGLTANGGNAGGITIEGTTAGTAAKGTVTVNTVAATGGNSDLSAGVVKQSMDHTGVSAAVFGDGGAAGNVTIRTDSTLTASTPATGITSVGGNSATHVDTSGKVNLAGNGGNVTISAGAIGNGTLISSTGGNGGVTDAASTTQKAGIGGNGGNVTINITGTGAGNYSPSVASRGGDAGNNLANGVNSAVFNGVGGKGGDVSVTYATGTGTIDLSSAGPAATIASVGGRETTSVYGNVNGNTTISVGTAKNLLIQQSTAIASSGNGIAAGFDRNTGQFVQQNAGTVNITSQDLTVNSSGAPGSGGVINGGGSQVNIHSVGSVQITATPANGPGIDAVGGATINAAREVKLTGGTSAVPTIRTSGGTVNIDVSHGSGGVVDLAANSIVAATSGNDIVGNITITGSANQLYGVNAVSGAGIATGTIVVKKTANGSLVDVGSAGRAPSLAAPNQMYSALSVGGESPAFSIAAQGVVAGAVPTTASTVSVGTITPIKSPTATIGGVPIAPVPPTPYDNAQIGTALLTAAPGTAPTDPKSLFSGNNYNTVNLPSFTVVKEIPRTNTGAPSGSKVTVYDPSGVTVNK